MAEAGDRAIAAASQLEKIGFVCGNFLFVVFCLRSFEPQSWRKAIIVGLLASMFSYLLFVVFLKVPMPSGFLPVSWMR